MVLLCGRQLKACAVLVHGVRAFTLEECRLRYVHRLRYASPSHTTWRDAMVGREASEVLGLPVQTRAPYCWRMLTRCYSKVALHTGEGAVNGSVDLRLHAVLLW